MPGKINARWHAKHPMSARATLKERVAWHLTHARACGCRDVPASIVRELLRQGRSVPISRARGRTA